MADPNANITPSGHARCCKFARDSDAGTLEEIGVKHLACAIRPQKLLIMQRMQAESAT